MELAAIPEMGKAEIWMVHLPNALRVAGNWNRLISRRNGVAGNFGGARFIKVAWWSPHLKDTYVRLRRINRGFAREKLLA
jgi:hypothetical protein